MEDRNRVIRIQVIREDFAIGISREIAGSGRHSRRRNSENADADRFGAAL